MSDPLPILSPAELSRYSRHILLDEIGVEGQRKLSASKVLVIGAGGLGSPSALYLAAAGIGTLGIADLDRVEEHNLQRQLLHDTASVGATKVSSAAKRLRELNPHINVVEHADGITPENAVEIFQAYDVVVDGTDNFTSRYLNNDAAFFARKPLVFGSVFKFEGQCAVFDPAKGAPCYRCLFPEPPAAGSVPGCGEAGVVGALCGVIGSLQALETIKLILSIGETLRGRLLTYDALTQSFRTLELKRSPSCRLCGVAPTLRAPAQVMPDSSAATSQTGTRNEGVQLEMTVTEAKGLLDTSSAQTTLIDVREPWETEICRVANSVFIPMRQIPQHLDALPKDRRLLIMCHHGARSLNVTQYLRGQGFTAVSNVAGGIAAWAEEIDPTLARY